MRASHRRARAEGPSYPQCWAGGRAFSPWLFGWPCVSWPLAQAGMERTFGPATGNAAFFSSLQVRPVPRQAREGTDINFNYDQTF
jgi:hypothetical protein